MARHVGISGAWYLLNPTSFPTEPTLVGGATVEECLAIPGDGKYVRIRNGNTSTGGLHNVNLVFNAWTLPGFDPSKVRGEIMLLKFRIESFTKISGTESTLNLDFGNGCGELNDSYTSGFNLIKKSTHSEIFLGMPATDFTMMCPVNATDMNGNPQNQNFAVHLQPGTSGGVAAVYEVRLGHVSLEYGEADAYMDVEAATYATRQSNGTVNWTNPQNAITQDGATATCPGAITTYSMDRFLPNFDLPGNTIFRGVDFREKAQSNSGLAHESWVFNCGHWPLSNPENTTPSGHVDFNRSKTPANMSSPNNGWIVYGYGPDFDWQLDRVNGFPGMDIARLTRGGYVLAIGGSTRSGYTMSLDGMTARVFYDILPSVAGNALAVCDT